MIVQLRKSEEIHSYVAKSGEKHRSQNSGKVNIGDNTQEKTPTDAEPKVVVVDDDDEIPGKHKNTSVTFVVSAMHAAFCVKFLKR